MLFGPWHTFCSLLLRELEESQKTMPVPAVSAATPEFTSPDVGDLSAAMFIAGAQALGLQPNEVIGREAQEKIIAAAAALVEGLRELVNMTAARREESERGN